jgi:hypothetical protein
MKIFWLNKISNKDLHNITNTKDMETVDSKEMEMAWSCST